MEKNVELKNKIDPVVYNEFRDMVGWGALLPEQVEAVLSNSICFSLEWEGETIAITRVLWDGGYTAYIADVIVHEKHRGHGIGKKMVQHALEEIKSRMKSGWKIKVILLAAKGRESFYEQFGFVKRPNEREGCGMNLVIVKE
nr:GNAT family N-acetyltransferase [uncultured Treponema sp.]